MASRLGRTVYRDPRWRVARLAALKRDRYRCTNCQKPGRLEVHHTYPIVREPRRDHFLVKDLVSVCRTCHFGIHAADHMIPDRRAWRKFMADGA